MSIQSGKWITNNIIEVQVQYGGGCKKHVFTSEVSLVRNRLIVELYHSLPEGPDYCRALVSRTIQIVIPEKYKNLWDSVEIKSGDQVYFMNSPKARF